MLDWKSRSLLPRLLYIVQCRNRYRPQDNSIDWWKSYVMEFFAPNGVVRVSVKDMPVFQQGSNHSIPQSLTCTEVPYEALPRLFQFKYENGVQEELLFLGNVIESPLPTGGTSIICYQAAEHLVFDGYSVVQYGHLKVVFNNNLKVQLLDFSVTGYDLHLDHSVIHGGLRQLHQLLETRATMLNTLASQPQLEPKAMQEAQSMMQQTAHMVKNFSGKMNSYLSFEWSYIQKVLHFMQMADVIGSMHELFHACKERNISPLQALQSYGKVSARKEDGGMGMGVGGMESESAAAGMGGGPKGPGGLGMPSHPSPQTSTSPALNTQGANALRMLAAQQGSMVGAGAGGMAGSPALGGGDMGPPGGNKPSPSMLGPGGGQVHQQDLQQQAQQQQQQVLGLGLGLGAGGLGSGGLGAGLLGHGSDGLGAAFGLQSGGCGSLQSLLKGGLGQQMGGMQQQRLNAQALAFVQGMGGGGMGGGGMGVPGQGGGGMGGNMHM